MIWQPGVTLEDLEKQAILEALRFYGNNKTRTAQALGIAIRTLDNKLAKYNGTEIHSDGTDSQQTKGKADGQKASSGIHVESPKRASAK